MANLIWCFKYTHKGKLGKLGCMLLLQYVAMIDVTNVDGILVAAVGTFLAYDAGFLCSMLIKFSVLSICVASIGTSY